MNKKTQTRIGIILIAAGLFTGCQAIAKQQEAPSPVAESILLEPSPDFHALYRNAPELRIQYGDGNRLTVTESAEIRALTAYMEDMVWEPSSGPDSVGYIFSLETGSGEEQVRLSATGHIVYQGKYYRSKTKEAFKTLHSAVMGYGMERIQGLLGLNSPGK